MGFPLGQVLCHQVRLALASAPLARHDPAHKTKNKKQADPRRNFRRGSACKLEKLKRRKKFQRNEVDLGLGVRSGVGACNAAEGDDVGVSVAAQTVVAVDAAGHLTGCV